MQYDDCRAFSDLWCRRSKALESTSFCFAMFLARGCRAPDSLFISRPNYLQRDYPGKLRLAPPLIGPFALGV